MTLKGLLVEVYSIYMSFEVVLGLEGCWASKGAAVKQFDDLHLNNY
jgi:hypothetical protein